jgi:hypothetical protein
MVPVAPARLSTTIGWPSDLVSRSAMGRAMMSATPPGGNGTIRKIGFVG